MGGELLIRSLMIHWWSTTLSSSSHIPSAHKQRWLSGSTPVFPHMNFCVHSKLFQQRDSGLQWFTCTENMRGLPKAKFHSSALASGYICSLFRHEMVCVYQYIHAKNEYSEQKVKWNQIWCKCRASPSTFVILFIRVVVSKEVTWLR